MKWVFIFTLFIWAVAAGEDLYNLKKKVADLEEKSELQVKQLDQLGQRVHDLEMRIR